MLFQEKTGRWRVPTAFPRQRVGTRNKPVMSWIPDRFWEVIYLNIYTLLLKEIFKMIRELYINNFKSLLNFRVELSKFVCIIGMNGAGKSTLLQAIDFITQIFKGDLKTWLQAREWQSQDLLSDRSSPSHKIFEVKLQFESTRYTCYGEFNLNKLTCTKEKIINETSGDILFEVVNRSYRIGNHAKKSIEFKYQGSALSALFEDALTPELLQIRSFL
ncbi:MAG: hypothetical protein DRQ41_09595, partial [Gammaproteobacteria bacterium]